MTDDEKIHVWACPWVLRNWTKLRCGYIQNGPGVCPYDHAEEVELICVATVCYPGERP